MTPAEEDALVAKIYGEYANGDKVYIEDAIRLAIRAAVAAERERAASGWTADDCITWLYAKGYEEAGYLLRDDMAEHSRPPWTTEAAAIRRGE